VKVGVFTALLGQFPLEKVIEKLKKLNISTVELGTGNYPGDPHCKLSMLDNPGELDRFKKTIADNGLTISALSCHGNPLHPDAATRKGYVDTSRKTIQLAEKLGVPVVIDFSGCPGDHDGLAGEASWKDHFLLRCARLRCGRCRRRGGCSRSSE